MRPADALESRPAGRLPIALDPRATLQDGTLAHRVQAELPVAWARQNVQLELSEPPDGLSIRDVEVDGTRASFVVAADAAVVKPGLRGNLIVAVSGERVPAQRGNQAAPAGAAARRRVPVGVLPAIPFEISPPK